MPACGSDLASRGRRAPFVYQGAWRRLQRESRRVASSRAQIVVGDQQLWATRVETTAGADIAEEYTGL